MRLTAATIVLIGLPALAMAQSPTVPPLPPIGLPLPSIGLPLPAIGLPPTSTVDLPARDTGGRAAQDTDTQQRGFNSRNGRSSPTVVYFIPTYPWGLYQVPQMATPGPTTPPPPPEDRKPIAPTGRLRLELKGEGVLQLYVDEYYVGSPDDVNGELELEAGPHKIEIRSADYETLAFDVKITADRTITYRGTLKPVETKPAGAAAPPPAATPSTFYFIPGCYLGNVPPEEVVLPLGCDLSRLIVRKP